MADPTEALRGRRADVSARVDMLRAEVDDVIASASSTTGDDEHDPEGATIGFERAQAQALLDAALAQLEDIDAALVRIAAGSYGVCTICSAPIGAERLEARPYALRCIACAR